MRDSDKLPVQKVDGLFFKRGRRIIFVKYSNIIGFASQNRVKKENRATEVILKGNDRFLIHYSINELANTLSAEHFTRISEDIILDLHKIEEIEGEFIFIDGIKFESRPPYSHHLKGDFIIF